MNIITIILALSTIDAVVIALVCRVFSIQQKKQLTKYEIALSDDRLIYIRKMIDTLYTYNHNPEKLRKHIIELMKADVLIAYHVVTPSDRTKYDEVNCKKTDKLLCKLSDMGFTPRELCMLFSLNNINSVYVKMSRMNKRLKEAAESDIRQITK